MKTENDRGAPLEGSKSRKRERSTSVLEAPYGAIGGRLTEVRGGISQAEFAATYGLHRNTLSRYENGLVPPDSELVLCLSKTRHVNPTWLLLGIGDRELSIGTQRAGSPPGLQDEVIGGIAEVITRAVEKAAKYNGSEMTPEARTRTHRTAFDYCKRLFDEGRAVKIELIVNALLEGAHR